MESTPGLRHGEEYVQTLTFVDALLFLTKHAESAIVRQLGAGPLRYSELAAQLPQLDDGKLGAGLRNLDQAGFVTHRVEPGPPLRVVYELSDGGRELAPVLDALVRWANA